MTVVGFSAHGLKIKNIHETDVWWKRGKVAHLLSL